MIWRWKRVIFEISFSVGLFVKLVFSKCQIVKICAISTATNQFRSYFESFLFWSNVSHSLLQDVYTIILTHSQIDHHISLCIKTNDNLNHINQDTIHAFFHNASIKTPYQLYPSTYTFFHTTLIVFRWNPCSCSYIMINLKNFEFNFMIKGPMYGPFQGRRE